MNTYKCNKPEHSLSAAGQKIHIYKHPDGSYALGDDKRAAQFPRDCAQIEDLPGFLERKDNYLYAQVYNLLDEGYTLAEVADLSGPTPCPSSFSYEEIAKYGTGEECRAALLRLLTTNAALLRLLTTNA